MRARAYELYEVRGRMDGQAEEDWLQAEGEVVRSNERKAVLAGVYCELREQACKQIFVRELEALRRLTHVGYYEAMAARPKVLTKACWARDCCEST